MYKFLIMLMVVIPSVSTPATAQTIDYSSHTIERCDGVVISCLIQIDDISSGSCLMLLPDEQGGMEYQVNNHQVITFGEIDSEYYYVDQEWNDITIIRNDFLTRHEFATWSGAGEQLPSCQ